MLTRRFKTRFDGIALPYALGIDESVLPAYSSIFGQSVKQCVEDLHVEFGPAMNLYPLSNQLTLWVDSLRPNVLVLTGGAVLTILDFFHTKHCPPALLQRPASFVESEEFTHIFLPYIQARTIDFLHQSAATILLWSAVRHLIPVKVLPESILKNQIHVSSAPYVEKTEFKVSLDITSIKPGGFRWLYDQSKQEWNKIRKLLDNKQPCPVVLVNRSVDLASHVCVLAIDYKECGEEKIQLTVYDTRSPKQTHQISLDFSKQKMGIITTFSNPESSVLQGIICVAYKQKKPPTLKGKKWLRLVGIRKLVWWYKGLINSN